jgi:hypothetical protein
VSDCLLLSKVKYLILLLGDLGHYIAPRTAQQLALHLLFARTQTSGFRGTQSTAALKGRRTRAIRQGGTFNGSSMLAHVGFFRPLTVSTTAICLIDLVAAVLADFNMPCKIHCSTLNRLPIQKGRVVQTVGLEDICGAGACELNLSEFTFETRSLLQICFWPWDLTTKAALPCSIYCN